MHIAIDIIVPTYNRPNDLIKFIEEIQKQSYPNFKVWIIDDHGLPVIKNLIPETKKIFYIRQFEHNRGPAYKRNIAIESGKGSIIISMDDDAWFEEDNDALQKIITYFDNYTDLGCLMFNIASPISKYDEKNEIGKELPLHITCGCAYRRNILEEIGGFSSFLHSYAEETDISLKIIAKNYKIRFAPDIKVFHNCNIKERSKKWYRNSRYNSTRNDLLIVVMRYPIRYVPLYLMGKYINHIKFDIKNKNIITALYVSVAVIFGVLFKLPMALVNRQPLSINQFKHWQNLFK